MPNVENILPHRWQRGGPSPNPGGRPSSRMAIEHAMRETSDGKEIVERLIALMRTARQESTRLKAACELRDWLFGSPSPDRALALGGTLAEIRGEVVRFSASFGPSMARGGVDGATVETEAQRVDADTAESDAEASVETPVETPELVETVE
jgi:hypothetical protein